MDAIAQLNRALSERYAIEREIGRGGMATVYLARDVKHDRRIALKVLDPELGAVLGVERFLSEIRVTANLQHPNLLPLFDSGEAEGLLFYVMPFVDGESLRHRIDREKQLPIDEALRITSAIAGALAYAHRHGVIHRDLKPENILLHEGQPLVADFGIALAVSKAGGNRITQTGLSLGTPQYMSPEQATGDRAVDGRTDIYSLGAVAYEMLTGEPPHSGTTSQAVIAKVLMDKPRPVRLTREMVPPSVEAAIDRALAKLPADRFATADEFAVALASPRVDTLSAPVSFTPAALRRAPAWRWVAAAAVTAACVGVGILIGRAGRSESADTRSISFALEAPQTGDATSRITALAISRDGQSIAMVVGADTASQVYIRRLSDATPRLLAGSNGAFDVFFSPDARSLAFITFDGHVKRATLDGGAPPLTLADAGFYSGGTWTPRQEIILGLNGSSHGLRRINASGGSVRLLTTAKIDQALPFVAPDGETILFTEWGPGFTEDDYLAIGSLSKGTFTTTKMLIARAIGVVDGRAVVVTADGSIKAVPFDGPSQRLTGDPIPIEQGLTRFLGMPYGNALSENGTLISTRGSVSGHLAIADSAGIHRLAAEKHDYQGATLSPDGRRVATFIMDQHGDTTLSDVFVFDLATETLNRLTRRGDAVSPAWTADGKSVVFCTWFQSKPSIWRQPLGGGTAEKLLELPSGGDQIGAVAPMPDGRGVVYSTQSVSGVGSIFYLPLDKPGVSRLIVSGGPQIGQTLSVSPDSRWIASAADGNVFAITSDGGTRTQISADGGSQPHWSRDGSHLFYLHANAIWSATLRSDAGGIQVLSRHRVPGLANVGWFEMMPDTRRALTIQPDFEDIRFLVTTNWTERLRQRVSEAKK